MKQLIKTLLREALVGEVFIDEMAYPTGFNPEEFKNIKSFAGKQKYAKERLLGKVGAGSARAVFKIDDEKVLKVALNQKGLSQNMEESEGYKQNYDILARVFDVDQDDMWIEMELASKVSPKRFQQLTGLSLQELDDLLRIWGSKRPLYNVLNKDKYEALINDENSWVYGLLSFIGDYQYPVPGDFSRVSSYGEVTRDGKPTVVVIDFGASESVLSTHYGRR